MRGKIINYERLNNILRKCRLVRQDKKKSSRSIPHVPCQNGMLLRGTLKRFLHAGCVYQPADGGPAIGSLRSGSSAMLT